jgi:hypothetical protein
VKDPRKLLGILSIRLPLIIFTLTALPLCVLGQTSQSKDIQETLPEVSGKRTTADETFELKIDERRFTRVNFEASTAVSTDGDAALKLQIGVALAARRIDVLLRNVQGRVRFRGSLERVLEVLNNRRTASPEPSSPR